jgi:hypothetical protein
MRLQDEMTEAASGGASPPAPRLTAEDQEPVAGGEEEALLQAVAKTEADDDNMIMLGLSAEATRDGPSELVRDDNETAGMAELQDRLRYMNIIEVQCHCMHTILRIVIKYFECVLLVCIGKLKRQERSCENSR